MNAREERGNFGRFNAEELGQTFLDLLRVMTVMDLALEDNHVTVGHWLIPLGVGTGRRPRPSVYPIPRKTNRLSCFFFCLSVRLTMT